MTRLPAPQRAAALALLLAALALPAQAQRLPQGSGIDPDRIRQCQPRLVMVNTVNGPEDLVARWSANVRALYGAAWANPDLATDVQVSTVPSWPDAIVHLSARPCRLGRGR
jgi:hypothetical protein